VMNLMRRQRHVLFPPYVSTSEKCRVSYASSDSVQTHCNMSLMTPLRSCGMSQGL